jgi:CxxC motif-containing protein (DUF1111 family)
MLMPHWRKILLCSCIFAALTALGTGLARVAAKSAAEAPAGFHTPSFNSAQSVSNGIEEPAGDTFARDQQVYEQNKAVADGLGPVYNAQSCVSCIRIRTVAEPASSRNSGLDTMTKTATSLTRPSSSTTARTRLPAAPSSMIAQSVLKLRSTSLRQKRSAHYVLPSTPWETDLWKPLTTGH